MGASSQKLVEVLPWLAPLEVAISRSYSSKVRKQLGIALPEEAKKTGQQTGGGGGAGGGAGRFPCADSPLSAEDGAWAEREARAAAARFVERYRPGLRRLFLQPFLETALSLLGGGLEGGVRFVEQCILL